MHISEMQRKIPKKCFIFEKMPFEFVARNYAHCNGNTCYGQSTCEQTVLRFHIRLMQTFSNSIYPKCMEKKHNSGALLISAVFGTR